MGDRKVSKGFTIEAWHYGSMNTDVEPIFMQNLINVDVSAVGCALMAGDVLQCLSLLDRVGVWLKTQWHNRLIIGSLDELLVQRCKQYEWPRRMVVLPKGDSLAELAEHLLLDVCEPLLRETGLVASRVAVRRGAEPPQSAELPLEDVQSYLKKPSKKLRRSRLQISNSEAALHTSNKVKLYNRWDDDPARPTAAF